MLKPALVGILLVALGGAIGPNQGCRDAKVALTHLVYWNKRDMRSTVGMSPNRHLIALPDSVSVPVQGRETVTDRDVLAATLVNPVASDDSSIARGERQFKRTCIPCHGTTLAGNGPVAAKFLPPPDLLNASSRGRKDGFMYSYIRNGGAVMPSYGYQVSALAAWDLVNYIRHMQRTNPR